MQSSGPPPADPNAKHVGLIGRALDLLRAGLAPFVARRFTDVYGDSATAAAQRCLNSDRGGTPRDIAEWDVAALLRAVWDAWNEVFRASLSQGERTLVSELREVRNRWAHQEAFSFDDAYRALDSVTRLLRAVGGGGLDEIERMKAELLRDRDRCPSVESLLAPPPDRSEHTRRPRTGSKYDPLREHLRSRSEASLTLSFKDIESLIGGSLPKSARTYPAWWANQLSGQAAVQAHSWIDAGFLVDGFDFESGWVRFRRGRPGS